MCNLFLNICPILCHKTFEVGRSWLFPVGILIEANKAKFLKKIHYFTFFSDWGRQYYEIYVFVSDFVNSKDKNSVLDLGWMLSKFYLLLNFIFCNSRFSFLNSFLVIGYSFKSMVRET